MIVGPTSRYFIWGVRGLKVCHGSRWVSQGLSPRYIFGGPISFKRERFKSSILGIDLCLKGTFVNLC